MICTFGKRCPRRRLPKAPTAAATTTVATTMLMATTAATMAETLAMTTLSRCICAACHYSISELYASVDECFQAMEAMRQCMEDLKHVVEDDYKFQNRNVHKLFGMVGNMKGKWCNSCGKYY
jgi:chromosome condensin MukBEF complex kleisin-like MukF subunit